MELEHSVDFLTGRVAVVTGGASGIGAEIARQLAEQDAIPVVWDVSDKADITCDVSDHRSVTEAMAQTVERYGVPTILVASAGVWSGGRVIDIDPAEWQRLYSINLHGALYAIQAVARRMVADGLDGSILAITSVNSVVTDAGLATYSSAKAALNMLLQIAAVELGPNNIRVNGLGPGPTATPMAKGMLDHDEYKQELIARTPLRRVGPVELVAQAAVNLLRSEWVTGQILMADGGSSRMSARRDWSWTGGTQ